MHLDVLRAPGETETVLVFISPKGALYIDVHCVFCHLFLLEVDILLL
jgi:hypothetical protein